MAIQLKRVAPPDAREAIVQFFWRIRAWPLSEVKEYYEHWDWRYLCAAEEPATVWIATEDERVVGHLAVNVRHFQVEGHELRVGVASNFRVDESYRKMMMGPLLARAAQKMVRRFELDLLLAYGNAAGHAMNVALGFKDLGPMQSLVEVRRWAPVLGRRIPGGAVLGPVADAATKVRKRVKNGAAPAHLKKLVARDLTVDELVEIDLSHWPRPQGLAWNGSAVYLANRFLRCPSKEYRVLGIAHERSPRLEGFLVTSGSPRLNVILCATNEDVLSEVDAVEVGAGVRPEVEVVVVPLLPQTVLAAEFAKAAFIPRSGGDADEVVQSTFWSAFWLAQHPLASSIARTELWKLWYGWNQH